MAALLRCSRFSLLAKYVPKIRLYPSLDGQSKTLVQPSPRMLSDMKQFVRTFAIERQATKMDSDVDTSARQLYHNIQKFGRVNANSLQKLVQEVEKQGEASDEHASLILKCLGAILCEEHPDVRVKLTQQAWEVLERITEIDVIHYNGLMKAHLDNDHDFSPTQMLEEMETKNIMPNRVTYLRFIDQYSKLGDVAAATQILEHMKTENMLINDQVFKAFIKGHFKAGDVESAKDVLGMMREMGYEPSGDIYCALMCGYASLGDFESVKKYHSMAEEDYATLWPSQLMELYCTLVISGHKEHCQEVIDWLTNSSFGFINEALVCTNQLIARGYDDAAYQLFLCMPLPANFDEQNPYAGTFFLRNMVKHDMALDKVCQVMKDMQTRNLSIADLRLIPSMAYNSSRPAYALKALDRMREEDYEMRCHYFWPAIQQLAAERDVEGVVNAVIKMKQLCSEQEDLLLTLVQYFYPAVSRLGENPEAMTKKLEENGFGDEAHSAMILWLTQNGSIAEALAYAGDRTFPVSQAGENILRRVLYNCVNKDSDIHDLIKVAQVFSNEKNQFSEFAGVVFENALRHHSSRLDRVEEVVDLFVAQNWQVQTNVVKRLQNKNFPDRIKEKLSGLEERRRGVFQAGRVDDVEDMSSMTAKEMKNLLENYGPNNAHKDQLFIKYCQESRAEQADELIRTLTDSGFELSPRMMMEVINVHCLKTRNLEKAKEFYQKLRTEFVNTIPITTTVVRLAQLEAEEGDVHEALKLIENHMTTYPAINPFVHIDWTFKRFVEEVTVKDPAEGWGLLSMLFSHGYLSGENESALEGYMRGLIRRDSCGDVVLGLHQVNQQYNKIIELVPVLRKLINVEDQDGLQKVLDMMTDWDSESTALNHLFINFLFCGHPKKAKKVIETPGLRARMPVLKDYCQELITAKMIPQLEELVTLSKNLFGVDREEMLFQLIRGHVRQNEFQKALDVLTMHEEEAIQPRHRTLRYLAKVLEKNDIAVPFKVPTVVQASNIDGETEMDTAIKMEAATDSSKSSSDPSESSSDSSESSSDSDSEKR